MRSAGSEGWLGFALMLRSPDRVADLWWTALSLMVAGM